MNFDIKTEQLSDHAYVISLAGEVDLYSAPEFKQQLLDVIERRRAPQVDRRLHRTRRSSTRRRSACSSAASGACGRTTGELSLVCSDRNIAKIFEITGLDRVFAIYPTRDEAVAQLDGDLRTVGLTTARAAPSIARSSRDSRSSPPAAAPSRT